MAEETKIVRPPEFKKVLEELHAVRLSNNLKSEIQARRDLEDVYHQVLEDVGRLEDTLEKKRADLQRAKAESDNAVVNETSLRTANKSLRRSLIWSRIFCYGLIIMLFCLTFFTWNYLSTFLI